MPQYDPDVIERFAGRLERRARGVLIAAACAGLVVGLAPGAFTLSPFGSDSPLPADFALAALLGGGLFGGLIGFAIGTVRARHHRLHAQSVLCQLHAQRATLAIWKLLRDHVKAQEQRDAERRAEEEQRAEDRRTEELHRVPEPVVSEPPRVASVALLAPPSSVAG